MHTTTTEIAPDIYRISTFHPDYFFHPGDP
jgi:hypothetical protein